MNVCVKFSSRSYRSCLKVCGSGGVGFVGWGGLTVAIVSNLKLSCNATVELNYFELS